MKNFVNRYANFSFSGYIQYLFPWKLPTININKILGFLFFMILLIAAGELISCKTCKCPAYSKTEEIGKTTLNIG